MVRIIEQVRSAYNPEFNFLSVLARNRTAVRRFTENPIRAIEEQNIPLFNTKIGF